MSKARSFRLPMANAVSVYPTFSPWYYNTIHCAIVTVYYRFLADHSLCPVGNTAGDSAFQTDI